MRRIEAVMLALSAVGLITSAYLVLAEYAKVPLVCSTSGLINCNSVIHSQYGMLFGVPVAYYGVAFFIAEIAVLLLTFNGRRIGEGIGGDIRIIYNALGVLFVLYLLYAEYVVGHICEYCTAVHIVTVLLFVSSLASIRGTKPDYYSTKNPY